MSLGNFQPLPQINFVPIRRALMSVFDKTNLQKLCAYLSSINCEIVATSSTYKAILDYGFSCVSVESLTRFPEMLSGRVKTLHPNIFASILARPAHVQDKIDLEKFDINPFDLVVCNLYPFQEALKTDISQEQLVEYIDIGGVSLLRAAAKNHATVSILCDIDDYDSFLLELKQNHNQISLSLRKELALKAFRETSSYDELIAITLENRMSLTQTLSSKNGPVKSTISKNLNNFPENISINLEKIKLLRYGENPHQKAAFYKISDAPSRDFCNLADIKCFHGKELSYNNMLDIEHAVRLTKEFTGHAAIIVKHNTPCGVGISSQSIVDAYLKAFEGDPVSPFGGIVATTTKVTFELAIKLSETFLEVIIAPDFHPDALSILQKKKNLRLVSYNAKAPLINKIIFTHVQGGFLVQSADNTVIDFDKVTYPTIVKPSKEILKAFEFAMAVVKHVRSNAIVIANEMQTISIAGGFTNRVDAVEQALNKSKLSLANAVLASDAFFPFPDSIEKIKNSGIKYIIQPGGSVQDSEVVKACDEFGISMAFTAIRHFKH